MNTTPVTSASVARWTSKDPSLALVYKFVSEGRPQDIPEGLEPYSRRRSELSVLNNCILIGSRVVIPSPGRAPLLDELHAGHPGIARMKALARSYVWWPSLDAEIEQTVRGCTQCQTVTKSPHRQQVHPWNGLVSLGYVSMSTLLDPSLVRCSSLLSIVIVNLLKHMFALAHLLLSQFASWSRPLLCLAYLIILFLTMALLLQVVNFVSFAHLMAYVILSFHHIIRLVMA